jgi:hypothetical protein
MGVAKVLDETDGDWSIWLFVVVSSLRFWDISAGSRAADKAAICWLVVD